MQTEWGVCISRKAAKVAKSSRNFSNESHGFSLRTLRLSDFAREFLFRKTGGLHYQLKSNRIPMMSELVAPNVLVRDVIG